MPRVSRFLVAFVITAIWLGTPSCATGALAQEVPSRLVEVEIVNRYPGPVALRFFGRGEYRVTPVNFGTSQRKIPREVVDGTRVVVQIEPTGARPVRLPSGDIYIPPGVRVIRVEVGYNPNISFVSFRSN